VDKTGQDVQRCWQELGELGVEAPRIGVKECLRSVLAGAARGKDRDATAHKAVSGRVLENDVKTDG